MLCPTDVVSDADNNLFVVDSKNNRIVKFEPSESPQCMVGCSKTQGSDSDRLNNPTSMRFDSYGNMYVSDTGNHRIQKFNLIAGNCRKLSCDQ